MITFAAFSTLYELRIEIDSPMIHNVDGWIHPKTEEALSRGFVINYSGWNFIGEVLKDEGVYYSRIFVDQKPHGLYEANSLSALMEMIRLVYGRN